MKKFPKIKGSEKEELEVLKLKKADLFQVKGGCTCGTASACHIDGTNEPADMAY